MTFEEWWKDSEKSVYWCNNPSIGSLSKCIAQSAWEAAQPKWTYCKDGMPSDKDGTIVFAKFGKDGKGRALAYYAGQWIEPFSVQIIKNVIAWMPLPEATGNIDK